MLVEEFEHEPPRKRGIHAPLSCRDPSGSEWVVRVNPKDKAVSRLSCRNPYNIMSVCSSSSHPLPYFLTPSKQSSTWAKFFAFVLDTMIKKEKKTAKKQAKKAGRSTYYSSSNIHRTPRGSLTNDADLYTPTIYINGVYMDPDTTNAGTSHSVSHTHVDGHTITLEATLVVAVGAIAETAIAVPREATAADPAAPQVAAAVAARN
ncbi:15906_t:CDS:2, partial [Acaulospora colombiana]